MRLGKQDRLYLGNIDAKRDWGYAPEYVEAMWLMLNQDKPDDFVIATGETHSVREFVEEVFRYSGYDLKWVGKDINEKGIDAKSKKVLIEIDPKYEDALLGLNQHSHIIVFSWFHESDSPQKRKILQVHPRGNKANPLTGVFGTRSPVRPNPLSIFTCRILSIEGRVIHIDKIDALDGTPVVDIKPYVMRLDSATEVRAPSWMEKE